jgi:hypothetical protein
MSNINTSMMAQVFGSTRSPESEKLSLPLKFINLQNTGKKVHEKRSKLSVVSLTSQSNKTQINEMHTSNPYYNSK